MSVQSVALAESRRKSGKSSSWKSFVAATREKRTFSITPTYSVVLNVDQIKSIAKQKQFTVENLGELGLSLRTDELSISFMKSGSAVIVGAKDENESIALYKEILGEKQVIK